MNDGGFDLVNTETHVQKLFLHAFTRYGKKLTLHVDCAIFSPVWTEVNKLGVEAPISQPVTDYEDGMEIDVTSSVEESNEKGDHNTIDGVSDKESDGNERDCDVNETQFESVNDVELVSVNIDDANMSDEDLISVDFQAELQKKKQIAEGKKKVVVGAKNLGRIKMVDEFVDPEFDFRSEKDNINTRNKEKVIEFRESEYEESE